MDIYAIVRAKTAKTTELTENHRSVGQGFFYIFEWQGSLSYYRDLSYYFSMDRSEYMYEPVDVDDMHELYWSDMNKFRQWPWEDTM